MKKLKVILSLITVIAVFISSTISISAYEEPSSVDLNDSDTISDITETSTQPTEQRDITKSELQDKLWDCPEPLGYILTEEGWEKYYDAWDYAYEIVMKENPTQEELNNAYYNLTYVYENLDIIGYYTSIPYPLGDYNKDEDINIKDVTQIQLVIARKAENKYDYCLADADQNLDINIKDATMIQFYCAKFKDKASCGHTGERVSEYYYNYVYNI